MEEGREGEEKGELNLIYDRSYPSQGKERAKSSSRSCYCIHAAWQAEGERLSSVQVELFSASGHHELAGLYEYLYLASSMIQTKIVVS